MNTKTFLILTALAGGTCAGGAFAQTATSGGAAPSAGAVTGGTVSTSASTSTNTATSPGGSNIGTLPRPGAPDMSSTMPARSVIDGTNTDATVRGTTPDQPTPQPSGIGATPPRAGVSPLSGLPTSEIPGVSRGTAPIGPHPATSATAAASGAAAAEPNVRARATTTQPVAGAAHPNANPQIGMGVTTVVPTPPPSAQVEEAQPAPSGDMNQVWVPGHYSWVGGQWTWVGGGWQRPPTSGATWVPGSYDAQNHRWTEGHWTVTGSATAHERERQLQRERSTAEPRR